MPSAVAGWPKAVSGDTEMQITARCIRGVRTEAAQCLLPLLAVPAQQAKCPATLSGGAVAGPPPGASVRLSCRSKIIRLRRAAAVHPAAILRKSHKPQNQQRGGIQTSSALAAADTFLQNHVQCAAPPAPLLSGAGGGIFFFHSLGAPKSQTPGHSCALHMLVCAPALICYIPKQASNCAQRSLSYTMFGAVCSLN